MYLECQNCKYNVDVPFTEGECPKCGGKMVEMTEINNENNEFIKYRFALNNGHIIVECVPDNIMKKIREQVREE